MDCEDLDSVLSHVRQLAAPPADSRQTDRQLLEDYLSARDEASFTALVLRHGPMVIGVARRMLRDPHAAEDVFQATFLILACKAQTIRRHDSLSSWLYGVSQRLAARVRQTGKRWETDKRCGVHMAQDNPESALTQRELAAILDEELKELSARFQAPLVLCYLQEQTQDDAARQLGWSKATLRRRLERGRELLRARLVRRGITLSMGLLTTALVGRADAGLPPSLIRQTALASLLATQGKSGAVSEQVTTLADWGLKTLRITRRSFVWWLLALVLIAGGGAAMAVSMTSPVAAPRLDSGTADPNRNKRAALGTVWSVAYSPDGRLLATGSGNQDTRGRLAVWDVATGKARLWLEHPQGVRFVAFSPDGTKVATACWDDVARIYDVPSGKIHAFLQGHNAPVNGVAFSPDGRTLASGSLDSAIILWDVEHGTAARRLTGHKDWVLSVAFFPDGQSLVSTSKDGTMRIWDLEHGTARQVFAQSNMTIECVAVSPDGQTIATGSWDRQVRLVNVANGASRLLYGHRVGVLSVCFSPDGQTLASVSGHFDEPDGGDTKLWSLRHDRHLQTLKGHTNGIWSVRFSPDGRTLATGSRDQTVKIWEVATGLERMTIDNGLDLFDDKHTESLTETEFNELWEALGVLDGSQTQRALSRLVGTPEQSVRWLADRLTAAEFAKAPQDAEYLRALRAIEVLELIDSLEARQALQRLGEAKPKTALTQAAETSYLRLSKRH
jgi:RNA polymerase sigma factor (sigma-70 family)